MIHEGFKKKLYFLFIWHIVCYAAIKLTLLTLLIIFSVSLYFCKFILDQLGKKINTENISNKINKVNLIN